MSVRLTTLSENTALKKDMVAEWGLSILIETDRRKILFDTGAGVAAERNADTLGIDLSAIDLMVLSHGHGDHTGGLRRILKKTKSKDIVCHPDIWDAKYAMRRNNKFAYIGVPFAREELEHLGAQFTYAVDPTELYPGIHTTGEVPMVTAYEKIEPNLFVEKKSTLAPDPLKDDLSLIIRTDQGLVIILGCSHRGVVNIIGQARNVTGEDRVHTVIGGTHLMMASDSRIRKTIRDLKKFDIKKIGVSHCTGFKAAACMAEAFGKSFFLNNAGSRIDVG